MREITDSLARALDRVGDFQAVQSGASAEELRAAVVRLQESVGIDDGARSVLAERLEPIRGASAAPGHVLLGVIVGLTAAAIRGEASQP